MVSTLGRMNSMRTLSFLRDWKVLILPWTLLAGCTTAPRSSPEPIVAQDLSGFRDPAFFFKKSDSRRNDLCVCIIGSTPKSQQGFFKLGCSLWFTRQSCENRRRIEQDDLVGMSVAESLETVPQGSKVVIGFVGHWHSAAQTVDWLETEVLPVASDRAIDVRVDNTACSGGDDPTRLRDGTNALLKRYALPNLDVRVNQAISSGLWDPYLPGKNNFWVEYSARGGQGTLKFPQCRSFEKRSCWGWMQGGGSGFCEEEESGKLMPRLLVCSQVEREVYVQSPGGGKVGQLERKKRKVYEWTRMPVGKPSFEIVEKKGYQPAQLVIGLKNNRFYDSTVELDIDPDLREGSDAYFLYLKRRFLEELPEQVHVDVGDDSLDEKTVERSIYSLEDVVIKERKPGFNVNRFVLTMQARDGFGKVERGFFGVYSTRGEALAARDRMIANPLVLKDRKHRGEIVY